MIPSSLDVDSVTWTIQVCQMVSDTDGEANTGQCQILIAENLCDEMQSITLWHEIIHAVFGTRGFDGLGEDRKYTEEEIASLLGPAIHSILARNATLIWNTSQEYSE